jgi:hypothetical protein
VTLFFVALGMQIPMPTTATLALAIGASLFLVATRFLSLFPILFATRLGLRASLLPAINLAQMSEFSLVILALGFSLGHVGPATMAVMTLVFSITSIGSTYMIASNHELQAALGRALGRMGLRDREEALPDDHKDREASLVLLGFYRDASSLLHEFEMEAEAADQDPVLRDMLVIDFNPQVLEELKRRGIRCLYGDISSMETLHHASISRARFVVCTLTDSVLKGTSNLRMLKQLRSYCPDAGLVMASETIAGSLELYQAGADFVFIPRVHSAHRMAEVLRTALEDGLGVLRREEMASLRSRDEVLA